MDQVAATATPDIQKINAALLAEYQAKQAAKTSATAAVGQGNFAATLQKIESKELPPPTPLAKAATPLPAMATTATEEDAEAQDCALPKISRSDRMACAEKATEVHSDDDFGWGDLVDLFNPLQHIPIVGTIYRELTGDEIKPEIQIAGSMAFGAATGSILLGAATGIASAVMEESTGEEPLVQVADALFGDTVQVPDPLNEPKIVVADASAQMAAQTGAASSPANTAPAPAPAPAQPVEKTKIAAENAAKANVNAAQQSVMGADQSSPNRALASVGGMRVGNTVYTSPLMRSAAKVGTATATNAPSQAQQTASSDQTLGALIHEQAQARQEGRPLPPELVQDMMLRALDKYKAAHATLSDGAMTSVQ